MGEEIDVSFVVERPRRKPYFVPGMAAISALFLFLFIVISGGVHDSTVAAYISYDVNPSFAVAVNDELEVLSVQAWNEDARRLFSNWNSYRYMPVNEFSASVMKRLENLGYLKPDAQLVIASAVILRKKAADNLKQKLSRVLENVKSKVLERYPLRRVTMLEGERELRLKAARNGLSLGKYMLYLKAKERGKEIALQHLKTLAIADIQRFLDASPNLSTTEKTLVKMKEPIITSPDDAKSSDEREKSKESGIAVTNTPIQKSANKSREREKNKKSSPLLAKKPDLPPAKEGDRRNPPDRDKSRGSAVRKDSPLSRENDGHNAGVPLPRTEKSQPPHVSKQPDHHPPREKKRDGSEERESISREPHVKDDLKKEIEEILRKKLKQIREEILKERLFD